MELVTSIPAMQARADAERAAGRRIGLVPTMGFLHEGHLSLVGEARRRADVVVVSLFVNKLQFNDAEDYTSYPRDVDRDARMLQSAGTDVLFHPFVALRLGAEWQCTDSSDTLNWALVRVTR